MARIPFGGEKDHEGDDACGDCGVAVGRFHARGCDQEQCPACGGQFLTCECKPNARRPAKPFSPRDIAIVEARKRFAWTHVGFGDNGDAIFEVTNRSEVRLPFLTIGVRAPGLVGGAWLDVGHVGQGAPASVAHPCYKEMVQPAGQVFFPTPDPTPQTRDDFWQFKRLPRRA